MVNPLNQLHLKILALLSAIVLWFVVITVENTVFKFPEPLDIEIINIEKNLNLSENLPTVTLYLRTDKEDLKNFTKTDFEVYVDAKDLTAGEHRVPIVASSKSPLAKVLKIEPAEVIINLSAITEKEVDVVVEVEGHPYTGYKVDQTFSDTNKATIYGAKSVIEKVDKIVAKLILDGTENEDIKQTVVLSIPETGNKEDKLVTIDPEQMVIMAKITTEMQQKEVPVNVKFSNNNDKTAFEQRITISPATVEIEGKEDIISDLEAIETNAIEISSLNRNRTVELTLNPPEGILLKNPDQKITVTLQKSGIDDGPTI